jgi:hypothetical protein
MKAGGAGIAGAVTTGATSTTGAGAGAMGAAGATFFDSKIATVRACTAMVSASILFSNDI